MHCGIHTSTFFPKIWRHHCGEPEGIVQATSVESSPNLLQGAACTGGRSVGKSQGEPDAIFQTKKADEYLESGNRIFCLRMIINDIMQPPFNF